MNDTQQSGLGRSNASSIKTYALLVIILEACYLVEVLKKSRTISYFIVFSILAIVPYIICLVMFRKDKENRLMKYVMSVGFMIFYMFIIFTTVSPLAYVYAIMMAVLLLSYDEIRLILGYMIGVCIGNIIQVGISAAKGNISSEDMPNVEIRIASLILFALFMTVSTVIANRNNRIQMQQVEEEKNRVAAMMDQILQVAEQITTNIELVSGKMEVLEASSVKTRVSMEEVTRGTSDTVDSIQIQLQKTEDIQKTVQRVADSSDTINENMQETQQELSLAKDNINKLTQQVQISNEANTNVSHELEELHHYTNQMESIIKMINDVTEQTSLLALNASIEAARAGAAGRGFAVVASEISTLATQTQQATVDITELIDNISRELSQVVTVIEQMIQNVEIQNDATSNTAKSFERIADCIAKVACESEDLEKLIKELETANGEIVKGVETVSAATEEVTAYSSETLQTSEENNQITGEVGTVIDRLSELVAELSKIDV